MTETASRQHLDRMRARIARLRQRIEDLEDLHYLEQAIKENKGKPAIPWAQVKKELGLE